METIQPTTQNVTELNANKAVITSSLIPDLVIHPIPREILEQARAALPNLRAHQEAILARRGGKPFTEEEITAALHEARDAHERGE